MNADTKREIHRLAAEGLGHRAIARLVVSTHATIAKVLAIPPPPLEAPAHMAPPTAAPVMPVSPPDAPALAIVRELLAEARAQFAIASSLGNSSDAQRYARTAAGLTPVLARLEREEHDSDGGFFISPAEIAHTEAMIDQRVRSLAERGPIRCASCSRDLSIAWGMGSDPA